MYKATLEASKYLQLERRSNRDMPSAISRPFRNRAFPTPASASPSQSVTALFGFVRRRAQDFAQLQVLALSPLVLFAHKRCYILATTLSTTSNQAFRWCLTFPASVPIGR